MRFPLFLLSIMYNYQKFLKEAQHATLIKTLQKMEREEEKHRSQLVKQLISNHNKRIEHSILTLIENPQKIHCYRDPAYHPREEDKSRRVVEGEMMFTYEKEPTRIIKNLHRNASLDLIPNKNPSSTHYRDSRVAHEDKKMDNCEFKCAEGLEKDMGKSCISSQVREVENRRSRQTEKSRSTKLPVLEKLPKTYFHTLETIVNKPDSLQVTIDEKGNEILSLSFKQEKRHSIESRQLQNENYDERQRLKEDKLRKCKLALLRCGVIPQQTVSQSKARHSCLR